MNYQVVTLVWLCSKLSLNHSYNQAIHFFYENIISNVNFIEDHVESVIYQGLGGHILALGAFSVKAGI